MGSRRLPSVDAVRGLVMVIMALDHVRDFVHRGAMTGSPTNLETTTPALFLTRWVTHICAPTFMFLAGVAVWLWAQRGRTRAELSKYLLTRGAWLVLLEVTVMRLAYDFSLSPEFPVFLLVLWALGWCMIALAALVWLPPRVVAGLSLAMVLLHNLLDGVDPARFGAWAGMWNLLHQPGAIPLFGKVFIAAYPLIPWIGVMALGYCFGPVLRLEPAARRQWLTRIGLAAVAGFVVLRLANVYGDPSPWATQSSETYTILSFLNTSKYPPSLLFLLMTPGPMLLLLSWFDRLEWKPASPLVVFGRVPLFYFVVHFYLAHLAFVVLALVTYGGAAWDFAFLPLPSMGGAEDRFPAGLGWNLGVTYLVWAVIVVGLYPVCRWFAGVKERGKGWWVGFV